MLARDCYAPSPELVWYGLAAFLMSAVLLCRYLKFYRQYFYEMFNYYLMLQRQAKLTGVCS